MVCVILTRLVLMGNEGQLRSAAKRIKDSLNGVVSIDVVGLDMEEDREAVFDESVEKATKLLGKLDAFVNCYFYEGMRLTVLPFTIFSTLFCSLFFYFYFLFYFQKERTFSQSIDSAVLFWTEGWTNYVGFLYLVISSNVY